jgi:eukaryotic-like serine/threonine-protein kinase
MLGSLRAKASEKRLPCLDEDAITDLLAGRVRLSAEVEEHLAACPICARLLGTATMTMGANSGLATEAGRLPTPDTLVSPVTPSGSRPTRARPALEPGAVLKETYEVRRLIGRGGMGEVYEVTHARLAGRYAVKVLRAEISDDEELLSRFRREAEITSSLRHPHIVQVFDFDRTADGCIYLAMEYLEGLDLARLLRLEGQLSIERVVRFAGQIASALTASHRRGVIHRDLKPENVFIVHEEDEAEERVKLMDFGLSKWSTTSLDSSIGLSRDQALIGTPRYMAPEQALGRNREVTAATDQFAFAAMVYEMLAGAPAFAGDTLAQLFHEIVYQQPKDLQLRRQHLPPGLNQAITKALAKAPADRFASVQDFSAALTAAIQPAGAPTIKPVRRSRAASLGFALALLGLASLAAWNELSTRSGARGQRTSVERPAPSATITSPPLPVQPAAPAPAPVTATALPPAPASAPASPAPAVTALATKPGAAERPRARRPERKLAAPPPPVATADDAPVTPSTAEPSAVTPALPLLDSKPSEAPAALPRPPAPDAEASGLEIIKNF